MVSEKREIGRFLSHSSVYAVGTMANRLGAFLLLPIYTRALTVGEYGVLELLYSVRTIIVGVLGMGIAHATLRFYFEYEEENERRAVVATNILLSMIFVLSGTGLIALFRDEIVIWLFGDTVYSRGLLLLLGSLALNLSSQVCLAFIRAREFSRFFVAIRIGQLLVQVSLNGYLVGIRGAGVEGALLGNFVTDAIAWVILIGFTIRHCGLAFHRHKAGEVLAYSYPFMLSSVTGVVGGNIDRFIINKLLGLEALGIYALAAKFAQLIGALVLEPFRQSFGPFRFSIMKRDDAASIQASIVRYLLLVGALAGTGLVFFTGDLLRIVSDPEFYIAADLLPLLIVAAVTVLFVYPSQTGYLYAKKTKYIFYISVVRLAASFVLNVALISYLGVVGACLAAVAVQAVVLVITNRVSQRFFAVTYEFHRLFFVTVSTLLLFLGETALPTDPQWLSWLTRAVIFAAATIGFIHSPILRADERAMVFGFVRSRLALQSPGERK